MEELATVIEDRFRRIKEVYENDIDGEKMRQLREQEKQRCQKQSWILSMLKLSKTQNLATKKNWLKISYQIMKAINPDFQYQIQTSNPQQNFLNSFVCLYKSFFDQVEDQFNFKVTIKNFLRPTNHNIINDLIKYLTDFTRDYYQNVILWRMKNQYAKLEVSQTDNGRNSVKKNNIFSYEIPLKKVNYLYSQTQYSKPFIKKIEEIQQKKMQYSKIYEIMDISSLPNTLGIVPAQRDKINVETLKNKMNQLFRDMKFRNTNNRTIYNAYLRQFEEKKNIICKRKFRELNSSIKMTYPLVISLNIQSNGFTSINVNFIDKSLSRRQAFPFQSNRSGLKMTKLQDSTELKYNISNNSSTRNDFYLNSLRVLRVSDNFLPRLSLGNNFLKTQGLQSSQKSSQFSYPSRRQNQKERNIQPQQDFKISMEQRRYSEIKSQIMKSDRKLQLKKISQRSYKIKNLIAEQKNINLKKNNETQEKVLKWIDKIKHVKDLERKRILGLY